MWKNAAIVILCLSSYINAVPVVVELAKASSTVTPAATPEANAAASTAPALKVGNPVALISMCSSPGQVALTFDDGPYLYTTQVVNFLTNLGIQATFFVNGQNYASIDDYQGALKAMLSGGHQIGSHTWSHPDTPSLSDAAFTDQVTRLEVELKKLVGISPAYFRPPYGDITDGQRVILGGLGYHAAILWNIDTFDYNHAAATASNIQTSLNNVKNGVDPSGSSSSYIILEHDVQPVTGDISSESGFAGGSYLAQVTSYLKSKGLKFVTIAQCTNMGGAYK